jgi:hypothetical protein
MAQAVAAVSTVLRGNWRSLRAIYLRVMSSNACDPVHIHGLKRLDDPYPCGLRPTTKGERVMRTRILASLALTAERPPNPARSPYSVSRALA